MSLRLKSGAKEPVFAKEESIFQKVKERNRTNVMVKENFTISLKKV
jgi:hypothetical protein